MPPIMTPDEAADLLGRILALDVRIEDLTRELARVEIKRKAIKSEIADTEEDRDKLSREIRNPPDMPIFEPPTTEVYNEVWDDGAEPGPEFTDDGLPAQDEVLAGVREAEGRLRDDPHGDWPLGEPETDRLGNPAMGPPPIVAPDETVQVFCCNRCNVQRPGLIHSCPACECPEYRLVDVPREVAAELHARWVGDDAEPTPKPRRSRKAATASPRDS
jgi:hypothetical protein